MAEAGLLHADFEATRPHLASVAYRILGSQAESEDAVQEAWLRVNRVDSREVVNLRGWLTTAVSRICLDVLRSRRGRIEEPIDAVLEEPDCDASRAPDHELHLADDLGVAVTTLFDRLSPSERVALVLHDMFDFTFDEIGAIIGRSPAAVRQLASRARRSIRNDPPQEAKRTTDRALVEAFLVASRQGDLHALMALLSPDIVLYADPATVSMGATPEVRGALAVAETFKGRAKGAQLALANGADALVWMAGDRPKVVFRFRFDASVIASITLVSDAAVLEGMSVELMNS